MIWKWSTTHNDHAQGAKHYGRLHGTLLVYAKSQHYTLGPTVQEHRDEYVASHYNHVEADTGRRYGLDNLTGPGGAAKGNPAYEVMGMTR